jgi:hypothetical protein
LGRFWTAGHVQIRRTIKLPDHGATTRSSCSTRTASMTVPCGSRACGPG